MPDKVISAAFGVAGLAALSFWPVVFQSWTAEAVAVTFWASRLRAYRVN